MKKLIFILMLLFAFSCEKAEREIELKAPQADDAEYSILTDDPPDGPVEDIIIDPGP